MTDNSNDIITAKPKAPTTQTNTNHIDTSYGTFLPSGPLSNHYHGKGSGPPGKGGPGPPGPGPTSRFDVTGYGGKGSSET